MSAAPTVDLKGFHERGFSVLRNVFSREEMAKIRQGLEAVKQEATKTDRKSTRLNSSHIQKSRMPSSA